MRAVAVLAAPLCGGLVSVVGRDSTALRLVGGALVLAGICVELVRMLRRARRGTLDRFWVGARSTIALLVAVGLWYAANRPAQLVLVAVTTVVLVGVAWWGRALPGQARMTSPLVAHIDGAPDRPEPIAIGARWWATCLLTYLVVAFALGLFGIHALVLVAVAVLAVAALVFVAVPILSFGRTHRRIKQAVLDYAPVIAMPYGGRAIFHTAMWAPYIARSGPRYVVVTWRHETFHKLAGRFDDPIVSPASSRRSDVDDALPPSLRAAFYVQSSRYNRAFLKRRRMTHVFVHHGDGDKPASSNRLSLQYDVLAVAGQAAIDRYAERGIEVPAERFRIIGRPQTESIDAAVRPIGEIEDPVVLYAPTWHGPSEAQNFCSLEVGEAIVQALLDRGATVIFRRHPAGSDWPEHERIIAAIGRMLAADAARTGRRHLYGRAAAADLPLHEAINRCDAMIADVSGIVTDFMHSRKPFAMVAVKSGSPEDGGTATERFREIFPSGRSAYVIEHDLATLDAALDEMLGDDPLAEVREKRRLYYLGGYDEDQSAKAFEAYVRSLAGERSRSGSADGA